MFYIEPTISQHIRIGRIGEDIACRYLRSKGYEIIERNFRKKWGEIDIVCKKKFSIFNTNRRQILRGSVLKNMLTRLTGVLYRTNFSVTAVYGIID